MGPFTDKAFEISLAKKILKDNKKDEIQSQSFNLAYFLSMYLKQFLDKIKIMPNWPKVQNFIDSSQETAMQIDITYIVRKLMFLDSAIQKIMEKHEIDAICLREKPTIQKAKDLRRRHFAPEVYQQAKNE